MAFGNIAMVSGDWGHRDVQGHLQDVGLAPRLGFDGSGYRVPNYGLPGALITLKGAIIRKLQKIRDHKGDEVTSEGSVRLVTPTEAEIDVTWYLNVEGKQRNILLVIWRGSALNNHYTQELFY